MKTLLSLLAYCVTASLLAFVAPADATDFHVTLPASGATCPDTLDGFYASQGANPCYYRPVGNFADAYLFSVTDATIPITFDTSGRSWHVVGLSGRAHPSYTIDTVITDAHVVELASGQIVAQLANSPFWAYGQCSTPARYPCSYHMSDHWMGTSTLPVGDYSFVVLGNEGGNRVYAHPWSITVPVAPVQPPLAPLVLTGAVSCDANSVCTMTPADARAITSVALDFTNNAITLTPAVDPVYAGTIASTGITASADDGSWFNLAGTGSVTSADDKTTIGVTFSFTASIDPSTGQPTYTSWVIGTEHKYALSPE